MASEAESRELHSLVIAILLNEKQPLDGWFQLLEVQGFT